MPSLYCGAHDDALVVPAFDDLPRFGCFESLHQHAFDTRLIQEIAVARQGGRGSRLAGLEEYFTVEMPVVGGCKSTGTDPEPSPRIFFTNQSVSGTRTRMAQSSRCLSQRGLRFHARLSSIAEVSVRVTCPHA